MQPNCSELALNMEITNDDEMLDTIKYLAENMGWNSFSHSYGESYLHLQFTPKYRRKLFYEKYLKRACKNLMKMIAKNLKVELKAVEFGPEHVHLFIKNWKNYSIAYLAQMFKGRTSYEIRKRLSRDLKKFNLGGSFWTDGYFHETVGSVTADARKFYIERCQNKHWQGVDYLTYQKIGHEQTFLTNFVKPSGL